MTILEKDLEEAMIWLRELAKYKCDYQKPAKTILALLADPRLPKEPSALAIDAMIGGPRCDRFGELLCSQWEDAYRALYDHLTSPNKKTKPKTKMVEVWRVEWVQYPDNWKPFSQSEGEGEASRLWAEERAEWLRKRPHYTCIRVTGPHQQEIPES